MLTVKLLVEQKLTYLKATNHLLLRFAFAFRCLGLLVLQSNLLFFCLKDVPSVNSQWQRLKCKMYNQQALTTKVIPQKSALPISIAIANLCLLKINHFHKELFIKGRQQITRHTPRHPTYSSCKTQLSAQSPYPNCILYEHL